jgi:hypothetical protein
MVILDLDWPGDPACLDGPDDFVVVWWVEP